MTMWLEICIGVRSLRAIDVWALCGAYTMFHLGDLET